MIPHYQRAVRNVSANQKILMYVMADAHGYNDAMVSVFERMKERALDNLDKGITPIFILLGDYIDRGPDSAAALDSILGLKDWAEKNKIPLVLLNGNHDYAFSRFMEEDPHQKDVIEDNWLRVEWMHGMFTTLESYGIDLSGLDQKISLQSDKLIRLHRLEDVVDLRELTLKHVPQAHRELLDTLMASYHVKTDPSDQHPLNYFFCHAGIDPKVALVAQAQEVLLGVEFTPQPLSRIFATHSGKLPEGVTVVHGHTVKKNGIEQAEGRISLDTGAYLPGGSVNCAVIGREGMIDVIKGYSTQPAFNFQRFPV